MSHAIISLTSHFSILWFIHQDLYLKDPTACLRVWFKTAPKTWLWDQLK